MFNILPMQPRDPKEAHRAATPLELLFDLVFVIAIAAAASGLHHAVAEAHYLDGLIKYFAAFFAIWWAWMNFTWFASAYDNDDSLYRILTIIIMSGALTMAAGIEVFFSSTNLLLIVLGFIIMRIAMVILWLRAAIHHKERRSTALWYAVGIGFVQCFWGSLLLLQHSLTETSFYLLFALGAVMELSVPVLAERRGSTPWHRHHIVERYGLLNIIVLGETLLAGSIAIHAAAADQFDMAFIHVALSAMVILFSLWWLYFAREEHLQGQNLTTALTWGYGHLLIYMSGAATGAGFAVLVDIIGHDAHVSLLVGDYAVAIPVATYMLGLWFVRDRRALHGPAAVTLPVFALLALLCPPLLGLEGLAVITLLAVIVRTQLACRLQQSNTEPEN